MGNFLTDFGLLAGQNQFLAYFIIYLATIFIGNISAFASFWLVLRGFLGNWGAPLLVLTIFLADISGDLLWYTLGSTLRDTRFGTWVRNHLRHHDKIEKHLQENGSRWVIFSKFMYASAMPIIFSVGWSRIPFKKFIRYSLLSVLLCLPIVVGLAYGLIFGLSPLRAIAVFKNFEIIFLISLALFLLFDYLIARFLGRFMGKKLDPNR